jgi:chemotaxis protein CheX
MHGKITIAEAAQSAAAGNEEARVELVAPFIEAAAHVIHQTCGETVSKGRIFRLRSPQTTNDVSALVAITGSIMGIVTYSMSMNTARELASRMIGDQLAELDEMGQSAVAELANMITGQAGIRLEQSGFPSDMSPPVVLLGHGSTIVTFHLTRLVLPLVLSFGEFHVDVAIREASDMGRLRG